MQEARGLVGKRKQCDDKHQVTNKSLSHRQRYCQVTDLQAGGVFCSTGGVFCSTRGNFLLQGVHFAPQGLYFTPEGPHFPPRAGHLAPQGVPLLHRGVYFPPQGEHFASQAVSFERVYFPPQAVHFASQGVCFAPQGCISLHRRPANHNQPTIIRYAPPVSTGQAFQVSLFKKNQCVWRGFGVTRGVPPHVIGHVIGHAIGVKT